MEILFFHFGSRRSVHFFGASPAGTAAVLYVNSTSPAAVATKRSSGSLNGLKASASSARFFGRYFWSQPSCFIFP